jgi:hypothetical protein
VTLVSLELPEVEGAVGFLGVKHFTSTASAAYETEGVGLIELQNQAELEALAEAIARDYYLWQLGESCAVYEGVTPWEMEGHSECVEFEHTIDRVATRVERGPWLTHYDDLLHHGTGTSRGLKRVWVVTNVCPEFETDSAADAPSPSQWGLISGDLEDQGDLNLALTGKQPVDDTLTGLSLVSVTTDQVIYSTGVDTFAATSLTSFGRDLIGAANAAAARTTLGVANQSYASTLRFGGSR